MRLINENRFEKYEKKDQMSKTSGYFQSLIATKYFIETLKLTYYTNR